jgi:YD repeat-containing protein
MNTKGQVVGTEDRWATESGGVATLRWESGSLAQVYSPHGRTAYSYVAGALTRIQTEDGGGATLGPGLIQTPSQTWRCQVEGAGRTITVGGARWRVDGSVDSGKQRVTDPAGAVTETRWERGLLAGWTDPAGGVTRVERSADRVTRLTSAAGSWSFAWAGSGAQAPLVGLNGAGSWSLAYDAVGNVKALTDPLGRLATWSLGGDGRLRSWGRGTPKRVWERDSAGRVTGLGEGGRVMLRRDSAGRLVGIGDGAGGEWRIVRAVDGRISELSDPGGARWLLTWDAVGRIVELSDPVGRITHLSRTATGIATVTIEGQSWQFGRDAAGRAITAEDPWGGAGPSVGTRSVGWSRLGAPTRPRSEFHEIRSATSSACMTAATTTAMILPFAGTLQVIRWRGHGGARRARGFGRAEP